MFNAKRGLVLPIVLSACALGSAAPTQPVAPASRQDFTRRLVAASIERTHHSVRYVSAYVRISYPGGDVPSDTGVCSDEIIRSYRTVGIDLQKEVHEDMQQNFAVYPNRRRWLLGHPDANIDHRRVSNLMDFFQRKGAALSITNRAEDYAPGDLVTWDLGRGVPHIGIVVDQKDRWTGRYMIVHHIGEGRRWRTFSSTGKSPATIGISALRYSPKVQRYFSRATPLSNFCAKAFWSLNSSDLPRGMLSVFHSLDRRCLARNTICPICAA
jgi:uncharacterized protein YijF (DUF1287 family)